MYRSNTTFREREDAVRAITERNMLLKTIKTTQKSLTSVHERMTAAVYHEEQGAKRLREFCEKQKKTLEDMQFSLTQSDAQISSVKSRISDEERAFRRATQTKQQQVHWKDGQYFPNLPSFVGCQKPEVAKRVLLASLAIFAFMLLLWLK